MKYFLFLSLSLLLMSGCDMLNYQKGNGDVISQKRQLEKFYEIHFLGNYEIGLKEGAKEQLVIVTDGNLLDYINSEIQDGILTVDASKKIHSDHGVKIFVTYQHLNKLKSTGASIINTDGPLVSSRFELEVPGASLIDMEVEVAELEIMLAGAGSVKLRGQAKNQVISLNGVGKLEAFDLESETCTVTVSGMGGVEVNVKENLNARVNGVGSIRYQGNPSKVDDRISGLGTIEMAEPG